jgi:UDP-glucose 4-epimerase
MNGVEEKKVLIIGGSGFIGQHLTNKLLESGHEVVIYDLKQARFKKGSEKKVNFIEGDVFDEKKLKKIIVSCDVVVHLVGLPDAGTAQKKPFESFKLNILSLQNVLESCRIDGRKKIIFPSSAAVYGITDDLPIREKHPVNPTNLYSWHKLICEEMIKAYHKNYDVDYVILRLFNVYGRGNKGVIDYFINKAKKGEEVKVFGPFQFRDFVYAGDVAEALYSSIMYEKANNRIINIGSGKGYQIKEILEIISEVFPDFKWKYEKSDFTMYDSIADITLAKILLNFEPHSSKEFIKKVILNEMI